MKKTKTSIKQKSYMLDYQKQNIKQIKFTLNYNTDKSMIDFLDGVPNKQAYLKSLITADMAKKPE